jgi:hypothetical protein
MCFLDELQSQLETLCDEQRRGREQKPIHMDVIRKNLPVITDVCGLEPYAGDESAESLRAYMQQAKRILARRSNDATLRADALMAKFIRQNGKEQMVQLKKDHANTRLEELVTGADQQRPLDIIDGYIVPRSMTIFLTPRNHCGRAPFYSSVKMVGSTPVKTLWFNLAVMVLMMIVATGLLLNDVPGKIVRKQ